MSWDRLDDAAWAAMVDVLSRAGAPWPRPLCLHDLRVFQGQVLTGRRADLPSERELARRWGVGKSTAHRMIASEEWCDPHRAKAWAEWRARRAGVDHLRGKGGAAEDRPRGEAGAVAPEDTPTLHESRGASGAEEDQHRGEAGAIVNTGARFHRHRTEHRAPPGGTPPAPAAVAPDPAAPAAPAVCVSGPVSGGEVVELDAARDAPRLGRVLELLRAPEPVVATDQATVLELHRALGRPPLDELASEVALVALWARWSPEPAAARLIRGENWAEKGDSSRSLRTICSRKDWGDRLVAAKAWRRTLVDEHGAVRREVVSAIEALGRDRGTPIDVFADLLGARLDVGPPLLEVGG